ncbi:aKG-HExxH-type peptide beta-hydroxylase [Actinoplanes subtropicus]|uniref:aKG-HExxH-type peptide beta-hydroxylase n=1 Tax=Actinoplanes subtropicus TaxID=543632 RepID=UPI0004C43E05|nr:HEXXH motif-containing putative peptide modification protein [Actinoplanes subtropicus]
MRTFRLSDAAFAALAAGRPSAETIAELHKAQISRHLLLLREVTQINPKKTPIWYAEPLPEAPRSASLSDPMKALHTSATLTALRAGSTPPGPTEPSPHHLSTTDAGLTLRVRLEDTDPLRARLGLTPSRQLTGQEVDTWRRLLAEAWHLLATRHRPAAATVAAVLRVIVPIEPDPGSAGLSATSAEAFGAVALSTPADATALAVGLLHETQHSLLNATRTLFDLVLPGAQPTYSPWRDDPRPPFGLLHGAYAYLAVTRFWRTEAAASGQALAQFEFARWRSAVAESADALAGLLTPAGARFVRALRAEVAGWLADEVDPEIERLARGANIEHRVRWRLRNLTVDAEALAEAWPDGRPPAATPRAGHTGRALERSDRLDLVHRLLRDGDQSLPPGSRQRLGDDAWLRGAAGTAVHAYVQGLNSMRRATEPETPPGPREVDLWAGIAIAGPWRSVRERPELVRAAYLALPGQELDKIADWLDFSS